MKKVYKNCKRKSNFFMQKIVYLHSDWQNMTNTIVDL